MIKNNPNFNYQYFDKLFDLKQHESDTIFDVVQMIMEIFTKVYNTKSTNKGVYYLGVERKFTTDIDPTDCISIRYAIGVVQELYIDLPLIQNGDTILVNGNIYNPMLQMIDKPLYMKQKTLTAVLQTNLGIFSTSKIAEDELIRLNVSGFHTFHPPIILYFLSYMGGLNEFEKRTGVRFGIESGCENKSLETYLNENSFLVDKSNIKPEFKDSKFDCLCKQLTNLKLLFKDVKFKDIKNKYWNMPVSQFLNSLRQQQFCQGFLSMFMPGANLKKFDCHQELVVKLDIFSAHFMKYKTIWEELFQAFSVDYQYIDIKDLNNKRIRCYELYLLTLLKHLYNLGMNTLYTKIATVSKEKRLRIYDNIRASTSASGKDVDGKSPAYSYDGGRNNSVMRLTEMTKINQTGEGGLTAEMFVGAARDLHDSQYGTLCPITTPDREKCGVTLYLCPSNLTKFNQMYYWPEKDEHMQFREPLENYDKWFAMEQEHQKTLKKSQQIEDELIKDAALIDDEGNTNDEDSSDHVDTGEETDENSLFLNKDMEGNW